MIGGIVENSTGAVIEIIIVIWPKNREKGYKVQIFRRNPFDNSTNRIVDKWNE